MQLHDRTRHPMYLVIICCHLILKLIQLIYTLIVNQILLAVIAPRHKP